MVIKQATYLLTAMTPTPSISPRICQQTCNSFGAGWNSIK